MLIVRLSHSGSGNRRVSVHDHRAPAILGCPVVANGETKFVRLAGCLAEESKVSNSSRAAALHFLLHAGVCDDQLAIVEHIVADEIVNEVRHLRAKLRRLRVKLRERLAQPVRDLHLPTPKLSHQLDIVVAG